MNLWWATLSGLVLAGLAACQSGGASDGLESATEGSSSSTTGTSASPDDTADGSSTSASSTSDGGESTTSSPPFCGDGLVTGLEECEGTDLGGATCESLGFAGGELACLGCAYDYSECWILPAPPTLTLSFSTIKQFDFGWAAVVGADYYQLEESIAPGEPFVQIGEDIIGESISLAMPLHLRNRASYRLSACSAAGCVSSAEVPVMSSLAEAVGYFKAASSDFHDEFGYSVALSGDGRTLAVGVIEEDSNATGIDGNADDDSAEGAGAVYVFVRDAAGAWSQQAYVKSSVTHSMMYFGSSVALADDGSTLAVGAERESSNATGVDGDPTNELAPSSGAAYVFVRDAAGAWSQQAYIKASNTDILDQFGATVSLSGDGNTLAVGAPDEDSNATGINGDQAYNFLLNAGAAYVFVRDGAGSWSQQAYVKASNTGGSDRFAAELALSGDGDTLAVGAAVEDGSSPGINGSQVEGTSGAGAVYVFIRNGAGAWSQQAYVKASNPGVHDHFGSSVAFSHDGDILAVGAMGEASSATGIDGDQSDDSTEDAGAVYVFVRDGMGAWSQQAYVKPSNTRPTINFGMNATLADDGNVLAVAADEEPSDATGIDGDQASTLAPHSGAVYVFVRDGMGAWSQQAYVKAPNTDDGDEFGASVALSGSGDALAVGARYESSNATGIGGDQANEAGWNSGAVYLY